MVLIILLKNIHTQFVQIEKFQSSVENNPRLQSLTWRLVHKSFTTFSTDVKLQPIAVW